MAEPEFAARCAWSSEETAWAQILREGREAGLEVLDLTASNPTRCGFAYEACSLLPPLAETAGLAYDPSPRGAKLAREAVATYYSDAGVAELNPDHLFLTTGTSEAYSFLFRLLCNPGDQVLVAQPSYPLFDYLADLNDVRLEPYPLFYDHGWRVDFHALRERITPRTRAIVVVHPNNPTGNYIKREEREELERLCRKQGACLIIDEVFRDYTVDPSVEAFSFADSSHPVLTFVLSGISKVCGLPQMKLAWIACLGPADLVRKAVAKLEVIADTFLSVSSPVQHALPVWLSHRGAMQNQIRERVRDNLATLDQTLQAQESMSRLPVEGGWYALMRLPALEPDERLAERLLSNHGVAVHAGSLFGLPESGWLVVSLLSPTQEFARGIDRVVSHSIETAT